MCALKGSEERSNHEWWPSMVVVGVSRVACETALNGAMKSGYYSLNIAFNGPENDSYRVNRNIALSHK